MVRCLSMLSAMCKMSDNSTHLMSKRIDKMNQVAQKCTFIERNFNTRDLGLDIS